MEIAADGSEDGATLVYSDMSALDATYSPDGSRIAFVDPAQTNVYVVAAGGQEPAANVTDDSYCAENPQWYYE